MPSPRIALSQFLDLGYTIHCTDYKLTLTGQDLIDLQTLITKLLSGDTSILVKADIWEGQYQVPDRPSRKPTDRSLALDLQITPRVLGIQRRF